MDTTELNNLWKRSFIVKNNSFRVTKFVRHHDHDDSLHVFIHQFTHVIFKPPTPTKKCTYFS